MTILEELEVYKRKGKKSKQAGSGPATILAVSSDDKAVLQVSKAGKVVLRSIKENGSEESQVLWQMENCHGDMIKSVCFIDNKTLVTCSKDECSVWTTSS